MNENMILNLGGGGSNPLNFKVVGNPQPSNPKVNTIWVNTDVPIGAWHFSATQPANMAEGDVWFPVGTSSPVEFNALKKNGIQVYPLSARQYVGGVLVDKAAKSYQGGEWADWTTYLYKDGTEFGNVTGGWTAEGYTASGVSVSAGEILADGSIGLYGADNVHDVLGTKNAIDLSKYSTIIADGTVLSSYSNGLSITIAVCRQKQNFNNNIVASAEWNRNSGAVSINVSAVTGEYYIVVYAGSRSACKGTVREIGLK